MPYALCPMPYALCPMPYALCPMPVGQIVPHVTEKGYINSDATGFDIKLTPIEIPDFLNKSGISIAD